MLQRFSDMRFFFKRLAKSGPHLKVTGFALFAVAIYGTSALAQIVTPGDESIIRNLSLSTRTNEAYDPNGIRVGDFDFSPSISNSLQYTDNVYATDINKVHDFLYTVRPELNISSDFVRHSISASFSAERGLYHDITSENYTDYAASVRAGLDVTGQTSVPLTLTYQREHIRRGSEDDRNSLEPTVYDLYQATTGVIHRGRSFALKVLADAQRFIFQDNFGDGGRLDNSDRDRDEYSLYTSIGMPEEGYFAPFVYSNLKTIEYKRLNNQGRDRDSKEYEIGVGTIAALSDITRASFNIGYINRDFADGEYSDIGDLAYGFDLSWEPSPLMRVLLTADRTVGESIRTNASASVNTSVGLGIDYELFPNVILNPSFGYSEREYEGIEKLVTSYSAGLGGTYKLNQNLWLSTSYRYITQDDEGADTTGIDAYDNNIYALTLRLQF